MSPWAWALIGIGVWFAILLFIWAMCGAAGKADEVMDREHERYVRERAKRQ